MASMTGSTMTPNPSSSLGGNGGLTSSNPEATVDRMAQTAHQTVDRLAEKAGPAIEKLRSKMTGANETLRAQADHLSEMQREWLETTRMTVREHPIATIAVAVAAGVLISKIFSSR